MLARGCPTLVAIFATGWGFRLWWSGQECPLHTESKQLQDQEQLPLQRQRTGASALHFVHMKHQRLAGGLVGGWFCLGGPRLRGSVHSGIFFSVVMGQTVADTLSVGVRITTV